MSLATLNGENAAFYPDGRARQRPSTLEPRGNERPLEVVGSFVSTSAELDSLWQSLELGQWRLPVREPVENTDLGPITLGTLALLRLTEVEVHGHDLDIGCTPWSDVFVQTALPARIRWLATRRSNHASPDRSIEGKWTLRSSDGEAFLISVSRSGVDISEGSDADSDAEISGTRRDLLAFLLGRMQLSSLSVTGDRQLAESFTGAFPAP